MNTSIKFKKNNFHTKNDIVLNHMYEYQKFKKIKSKLCNEFFKKKHMNHLNDYFSNYVLQMISENLDIYSKRYSKTLEFEIKIPGLDVVLIKIFNRLTVVELVVKVKNMKIKKMLEARSDEIRQFVDSCFFKPTLLKVVLYE